jgi:hypothetical protein
MGLRSWFTGLLEEGGDSSGDDDVELDLLVDVERRAGAIVQHYDCSGEQARRIAEILAGELTREEGYARRMIADRVRRELDLDEDLARTIVDTEVASIRNLARVRKFTAQTEGDARFRWIDSVGRDDSPVCSDVRDAIEERGPVDLAELRELIREAASDHESGTPDRADDLIPHESCRHTVVRHVES